jgi:hypothetical protein
MGKPFADAAVIARGDRQRRSVGGRGGRDLRVSSARLTRASAQAIGKAGAAEVMLMPLNVELVMLAEQLRGGGPAAAQTEAWIGLVAPARTPKSVIQRLNREIGVILKDADFRQRLAALSLVPVIASPEEFRTVIEADHQRWDTVICNAGIQLD